MSAPLIFAVLFLSFCAITILIDAIALFRQYNTGNRHNFFRFIDRCIIILSIIVILGSLLWDFNYLNYTSAVEHKDWKTITLNDFKGLKKPFMTLDGQSDFAFISSTIEVHSNAEEIKIETLFHPCRSYVFNRNVFSKELLTHELYHFHITEYCARLMRQEVSENVQENKEINMNSIKNNFAIQERELQYRYDDETYHSYVVGKQIEWQNKIDSSLASLKNYAPTSISLKK